MAAPGPASCHDSLKLMGYEAYVETRNSSSSMWKRAEVLKPEVVHDSKITGYIVSSEGTEFRIYWRNLNGQQLDIASYYYADGRSIKGVVTRSTDMLGLPYHCDGLQEDDHTMRPLKFAKLELTDDDALATTEEDVVKNVGCISIKMHRAVFGKPTTSSYRSKAQATVLSERSKKARLSHASTFGDAIRTAKPTFFSSTLIDPLNDPYCEFQFFYLSRDLLEARGIVPYANGHAGATIDSDSTPELIVKNENIAPKRKASTTIIDIDDSDDESELEKLRRENAALRKKVKTEPGSGKTKPGQVIDLTLD